MSTKRSSVIFAVFNDAARDSSDSYPRNGANRAKVTR